MVTYFKFVAASYGAKIECQYGGYHFVYRGYISFRARAAKNIAKFMY